MVMDRFPQNNAVPLFLSDYADPPERSGVLSSTILKTIFVIFTAGAILFAIVSVGNPIVLFARGTASQVSTSAPPDSIGQSVHPIQSTASAQALPPTAREAPAGDELLAAFKTAFESQTEVDQPLTGGLFNQFQAWAAKEDAQAQVQPMHSVQDARAQVVPKARTQPVPKPRPIQPAQTGRAQDQALQNAQWPARSFGWHD